MPNRKNTPRFSSCPHSSVNSTAVLAGLLEAHLHRQPGHKRGDEHAGADRFGRQQAEQRQGDHAKLLERFRHPSWRRARPSSQPPARPMTTPTSAPKPSCSPMNCTRLAAPPSILAAAIAMKKSRNGTDRPSFRPASTLSAWRIRMGTRGLFTMICPRPASVGARMAPEFPLPRW